MNRFSASVALAALATPALAAPPRALSPEIDQILSRWGYNPSDPTGTADRLSRSSSSATIETLETRSSDNPDIQFGSTSSLSSRARLNFDPTFTGSDTLRVRRGDGTTEDVNAARFELECGSPEILDALRRDLRDRTGDQSLELAVQTDAQITNSQYIYETSDGLLGTRFEYAAGIVAPRATNLELTMQNSWELGISSGREFTQGDTIDLTFNYQAESNGVFPVDGSFGQGINYGFTGNEGTDAQTSFSDFQFDNYSQFAGSVINFGFPGPYDGSVSLPEPGVWEFAAEFSMTMTFELIEGADGNGWLDLQFGLSQSLDLVNLPTDLTENDGAGAAFYDAFNTFAFDLIINDPNASIVIPAPGAAAPLAIAGILGARRRRGS